MSDKEKKIAIPASLTEEQLQPQAETLQRQPKERHLYIGIPKEVSLQEKRIPLVPTSVATLVNNGHRVVIEAGAGEKSRFTDHEYSEAGAEIAHSPDIVYKADTIIKAAPPTPAEITLMRPGQMLISPLQLSTITEEYIQLLRQHRVTALAMEYIKDDSGHFPIVRTMSEMAGISAMLTAGELLTNAGNGPGVLLGGISGVPSTKVVILGAGIVAEYATRAALGLGAEVRIFDDNIYKLKRLQNQVGRPLYTSSLNPFYLERELMTAEVAIGAMHSESGRTPVVVAEHMVEKMKPGAVIIDVSIDQGGCFATSRVTTLEKPTFVQHGVIHYCVPNLASRVARSASIAFSNILTPMLLRAGGTQGVEDVFMGNLGLRHGVYTYRGFLTNAYLGRRFDMKTTDLSLILTSRL